MDRYDLPYSQQISIIRDTLEMYFEPKSSYGYNYLKNKCMETTRFTHLILPNLIEQVGYCTGEWHAWNYDTQNKIIVDVSGWQFDEIKNSRSNPIFQKDSKYHISSQFNLVEQEEYFKFNVYESNKTIESLIEIYNHIYEEYTVL
jgi:hypothetical protein